jgi:pimeloyl-ACP methyl ester carboxylesterase
MPYATSESTRLHYEIAGDRVRPALVMIRGLARSASYWEPLVTRLAPHLCLLLFDNRGTGRSDATWGRYTTQQIAADTARVMDAAGVRRAHVFGMSLGGMIAQELALAHGERVDRLILGCTTPGGPRARPSSVEARLGMLEAAFGRPERFFRMLVSDASWRAHPEIRRRWLEITRSERAPLRGLLGQLAAALRHDAGDRLAHIKSPTLVITGDDDIVIPPENSRLLAAAIPNATLTMLSGARHDFATDSPDDTARAILSFLGAA